MKEISGVGQVDSDDVRTPSVEKKGTASGRLKLDTILAFALTGG